MAWPRNRRLPSSTTRAAARQLGRGGERGRLRGLRSGQLDDGHRREPDLRLGSRIGMPCRGSSPPTRLPSQPPGRRCRPRRRHPRCPESPGGLSDSRPRSRMVGLVPQDIPAVAAEPLVVVTQDLTPAGSGCVADLASAHRWRRSAFRVRVVRELCQGGPLSAEAGTP